MIRLKNIKKSYGAGENKTEVLKGIDLEIQEGEFIAIMGPSGSGKSTLMNILGTLDVPSSGEYFFETTDIRSLNSEKRALFRRYVFGFVFQGFNLLKRTNSLENVEMPLIYQGVDKKIREQRSYESLVEVGLEDRVFHEPSELSGGQQQRVAIARAIVTKPKILFADEPTGNLDMKRSHEIMKLLKKLNQSGITIIMVTHEDDMAEYASRLIHVQDGVILSDERRG